MNTKVNTKYLVLAALFIALSFIGANIRIFGSVAFDSLPAFLAALLLGPFYGAVIGLIGHLLTATLSGFPLSLPLHIVIAVSMAVTMLGFGFTYKALNLALKRTLHKSLKNRMSMAKNLAVTGVVGVLLNAPVSFGLSMATLALMAGAEAAMGLLPLFPFLLLASVINVVLSIVLFKSLEKVVL